MEGPFAVREETLLGGCGSVRRVEAGKAGPVAPGGGASFFLDNRPCEAGFAARAAPEWAWRSKHSRII